jgi:biopolymer transport protein ExbB/TolQ
LKSSFVLEKEHWVGEVSTLQVPDLTLLGLIAHADIIVKCVVAGLLICSLVCWAIIFEKALGLFRLRREIAGVEALATNPGQSIGPDMVGLGPAIMAAAQTEYAETIETNGGSLRLRLEEAMRSVYLPKLHRLETGLPFLATIGSSAPFIGLFGTVWGIMHSFTSIAAAKDTSLAVVAPGIAEALFATAIGLAAAIPAVIGYNHILTLLSRSGRRLSVAVATIAKALVRESRGLGTIRLVR